MENKEAVEVLRKAINGETIHISIPMKAKAMFLNKINLGEIEKNIEFDIPINQIVGKRYLEEALLALEEKEKPDKSFALLHKKYAELLAKQDRLEKWINKAIKEAEIEYEFDDLYLLKEVREVLNNGKQ